MRYYLIAGEASGDLHGSNLIKELYKQDPLAVIRCWGGEKMQATGATLAKHIKTLAFMGFWEVLTNLFIILKNISFCKKDILAFQPDVVILIDYPGFNFRLLLFLKENNIKIFYYISPQVWAWKEKRVATIKKYVDELFVIFPFEVDFYKKHQMEVNYFGHPLLDEIAIPQRDFSKFNKKIALLPGSRKQEIGKLLPIYLSVIPHFPDFEFEVAGIDLIEKEFYTAIIQNSRCKLVFNSTYSLLQNADAAIVTSGTATLETALLKVPQVVAYKGNFISVIIAKWLIKHIKYICIVNLILDKAAVQELIQQALSTKNLVAALQAILAKEKREAIEKDYAELVAVLGEGGASEKIASKMIQLLKKEIEN